MNVEGLQSIVDILNEPTPPGVLTKNRTPLEQKGMTTMNAAHTQIARMIQNMFMQVADVLPKSQDGSGKPDRSFNFIPLMTLLQKQFENDENELVEAQRNADLNSSLLSSLDDAGQSLQSAALVAWETVNGLKNRLDNATGLKSQDYPNENISDFIYASSASSPEDRVASLKKIATTLEDGVTLRAPAPPPDKLP